MGQASRVDGGGDTAVREAAFRFLESATARHGEVLTWGLLRSGFSVDGRTVPLIGYSGIWTPSGFSAPIAITTAPPVAGKPAPYADDVRDDGLLEYRYQGDDPTNHFNRRLREAHRQQLPLIYFLGVAKGRYRPFWPVLIAEDHPGSLHVAVAVFDSVAGADPVPITAVETPLGKAYARRLTLQRLHQAGFRERVLRAYESCCAMCRLRHVELLDAAHILPDSDPRGLPVVENGLSLCKIHHAAYDRQLLGVRPDHVIEVQPALLAEEDGPMLRHGLQAIHGTTLVLPRRSEDRPNTTFLEERYEAFRAAS